VIAHHAADLESVKQRQEDVEKDQVGALATDDAAGLETVGSPANFEAMLGQIVIKNLSERFFIFNNQNLAPPAWIRKGIGY
jgi:hypothetical protein